VSLQLGGGQEGLGLVQDAAEGEPQLGRSSLLHNLEALGQEGADQGDALLQSSGDLLLKYNMPAPEMFSELEQAQINQASRQQQQQVINNQPVLMAQSPTQAAVKQEHGLAQATDQQRLLRQVAGTEEQVAKRQRVGEPAKAG
jgi:hypothetical protein